MPTGIAEMTDHTNVSLSTAMEVMQVKETETFITTESMEYGCLTQASKKEDFQAQYADILQTARNHLHQNLKVTICTITVLLLASFGQFLPPNSKYAWRHDYLIP